MCTDIPCRCSAVMFRVANVDELHGAKPGAFYIGNCIDGDQSYQKLWAKMPCNGGELHAWPLKPAKPRHGGDTWHWDGNMDQPTLSPSILAGARTSSNGAIVTQHWHGYVLNGVMRSDPK